MMIVTDTVQVCHKLWLSKAFYKKHGPHKRVPEYVQVRPSPLDCIELERLGHLFFKSVVPLQNKKDTPKTRPLPSYAQTFEEPASKRRRQGEARGEADLEALWQELERMQEDNTRSRLLAEQQMQQMRKELDEIKRQLALLPAVPTSLDHTNYRSDEPQLAVLVKRELDFSATNIKVEEEEEENVETVKRKRLDDFNHF